MTGIPILTARIDELIALFNARGMDLPDGLFDRQTQFRLNGTPFEQLLGGSSTDPLVLMLTRGPAGYRFAVKGLQHAVPDAHVERGDVEQTDGDGQARLGVRLWLSGHLHPAGDAIETVVDLAVTLRPAGPVAVADAVMETAALDRIRAARLQP